MKSLHESILRLLSSPFRQSNTDIIFIPTGPKELQTQVMKSKAILDLMNDDDADVFVIGLIDKYANSLQMLCTMKYQ